MSKIKAWAEAMDELIQETEIGVLEKFTKHDTVKNRLELIEPKFIEGVGRIITFGAEKYSAHNWKRADKEDIDRIKGALLRHMMAYLGGQEFDPETGESHLYHAACNLMFLDYFDRHKIRKEGDIGIG